MKNWLGLLAIAIWTVGSVALAADQSGVSYNSYGMPGLIDMPTARSAPDAALTGSLAYFRNTSRTTLSFQITPRLTGAFRYAGLERLGGVRDTLFDRSFDLQYRLLDEGRYRPAVAVGLRDFIGTGVYSSEYIVASKALTHRFGVTAGIGWGRLATSGGFANPLAVLGSRIENRHGETSDLGGQLEAANWFRGDAAVFGGLSWQVTDRVRVKLEYASDDYPQERGRGALDINSQINLGIEFQWRESLRVQASYMYGSTFGVAVHLVNNPKQSVAPSGTHSAPYPVRVRGARRDLGWASYVETRTSVRARLAQAMQAEGLIVERLDLRQRSVRVEIRNPTYGAVPEAIGRTARILTQVMPDSIEEFVIVPLALGLPMSSVTLTRSDVEAFETAADGAEQILARASLEDASGPRAAPFPEGRAPKFVWGLGPYLETSLFDPDAPIRVGAGVQASAEWALAPGTYLSGTLRQRLGGSIGDSDRVSTSVLPRVRSDSNIYDREGETALSRLALDHYFRPGKDLYGRLSFGYLEPHFAGLSAEFLWKPVTSRFAVGAELNYVRQRDFDQDFGLRDYDVLTGHVSGYLEMRNGFHLQLDAGRYLAGDWGATISLDREFRNGWRVGAYATCTDVSFDDFGEGSFDKGIRITVPLEPFLGRPSRKRYRVVIQPLTRDGGARLRIDGRLYETVREFHASGLKSNWGRFWR